MILDAVHALPGPIFMVLVFAVVVAYTLGGLFLFRRLRPDAPGRHDNDVAGAVSNLVGVVFAVLMAFIAVTVWQEFNQADAATGREASAASDVYRQAFAYPEPLRSRVKDGIQAYVETVITEEWPLLAKGRLSDRAWALLEGVQADMLRFEPRTEGERVVHREQIHDINVVLDERRARLRAATQGLSPQMWMVLIAGSAITLALTWFFEVTSLRVHALMTSGLAVAIALVLYLIGALDYPFGGDIAVGPDAFVQVRENIKRVDAIR